MNSTCVYVSVCVCVSVQLGIDELLSLVSSHLDCCDESSLLSSVRLLLTAACVASTSYCRRCRHALTTATNRHCCRRFVCFWLLRASHRRVTVIGVFTCWLLRRIVTAVVGSSALDCCVPHIDELLSCVQCHRQCTTVTSSSRPAADGMQLLVIILLPA